MRITTTNQETGKETKKYSPYTGEKVVNTNSCLEGPEVGLSRQRHQSNYYKYVQRIKEAMFKNAGEV